MFGGGRSGDLAPTLVVHLAGPAQMTAFLDRQRERGLVTRAVVADRVEVVSATLPVGAIVSWALDGEWMWVHFAAPGTPDDGARWFIDSHAPHGAAWTGPWAWAEAAAGTAASVVGFLDLRGALATAVARLPDAVACAKLADPVERVGFSLEADDRHFAGRLALDTPRDAAAPIDPTRGAAPRPDGRAVGDPTPRDAAAPIDPTRGAAPRPDGRAVGDPTPRDAAAPIDRLRALLLPPPPGWAAASAGAALAAQWNLDLAAVRPALAPCLAVAGVTAAELAPVDDIGLRAGRAVLVGFEPDSLSGSGAIALDVTSPAYLDRQLDRIPLRRTLERARTFGGRKGHAIAIPFSVTVEYVLEPQLAIAALGEGLLDRMMAPPAGAVPTVPPIFALDAAPPAMSAHAWETVIDGLARGRIDGSPGPATRRAVEHLMAWRDAHLAITAEAGQLVVTASGNRR